MKQKLFTLYHHCAAIEIVADPSKPIDAGWPVTVTRK
jgi:hypothetical protein